MSKVTKRVCRNIKKLRKRAEISQAKLAERANISKRHLVKLEQSTPSNVTVETVERIAAALEEKPEKLLCAELE